VARIGRLTAVGTVLFPLTCAVRIWYRPQGLFFLDAAAIWSFSMPAISNEAPLAGTFLFLSDLLGGVVFSQDGARLGRLADLIVDGGELAYPRVKSLRVRVAKGELRRVEWEDVAAADPGAGVWLKRGNEALLPPRLFSNEIPLAQDVLDRQIVDTDGAKVERVNDLHLLRARGDLRVAHVDVGFRGLVRRMGWQRVIDQVVRTLKPSSRYLRDDKLVAWKYVQPLAAGSPKVRLDVGRGMIASLHPSDLADILEDLDRRERAVLFSELPVEQAADALEEIEPELQRELLQNLDPEKAADLLEAMQPDDAADLLSELPASESGPILAAMEAPEAREVQQLLTYSEDTAGGMMNTEFLHVTPSITVAAALAAAREQAITVAHVHDLFVLGFDRKLVGVVSLRELLIAPPDQHVVALMHEHPAPLRPDEPASHVAELAAKYNLYSLPVEDEAGKILGVVTLDDVLEQVLHG